MPVAILAGSNVGYIYADHLNAPRAIADQTGKVVWRWDADAFGSTPANEDSDKDGKLFAYNLRFPGQYFDKSTGLHYNGFRDYEPGTGRYIQSDPIGLGGGANTYNYVGGSPVSYSDFSGLWALNFDFFEGWGWGISIGYDTKTCQSFITGRVGGGIKFGLDFDQNAGRPGVPNGSHSGFTFGAYAQGGRSIGIKGANYGVEAKSSVGRDFGSGRGWITPPWNPDISHQPGQEEPGGKTGLNYGFSTGFEVGYYGRGDYKCGCTDNTSLRNYTNIEIADKPLPWTQADFLYGRYGQFSKNR
ncbi:MAG: RHS repeat-associated core domain-containing protein [Methylococcales bacterium]